MLVDRLSLFTVYLISGSIYPPMAYFITGCVHFVGRYNVEPFSSTKQIPPRSAAPVKTSVTFPLRVYTPA